MGASHLPQEIVEGIIDLFVGDTKNLLSCSLVSTGWTYRSHHHLFADIELRSLSDLQSWFSTSSGRSTVAHYVRSLRLVQGGTNWVIPDTLAAIPDNLTSFHNVESLALVGLDLTRFDKRSLDHFFRRFSENLISLSIVRSTVNPNALLSLLYIFPKLDNLKLDNPRMGRASVPSPSLTAAPRLRGKLTLLNIERRWGSSTIAPFAYRALPIAFRDLCVENCTFKTSRLLKDLFAACKETVRVLKLVDIYMDATSPTPLIDLSPFEGLEEVGLCLTRLRRPDDSIEKILRTVTSIRVRKIILNTNLSPTTPCIEIKLLSWSRLDTLFLKLANTLDGADEKLEIVFNIFVPNFLGQPSPVELGRFLGRCRTKATVRFDFKRRGF